MNNNTTLLSKLGTASTKDIAESGNASSIQVVMGNDSRLTDARKASDVYNWAKVNTKPTYTYDEVGAAPTSHNHDDRYYTETEIDTKLNSKSNTGHTHDNSTITSLDASKIISGTIDIDRLPKGALKRCVIVADDTARFALTTSSVQTGDTVKVTDTGVMYYVVDDSKLFSEAGYEVYTAGSATSVHCSRSEFRVFITHKFISVR